MMPLPGVTSKGIIEPGKLEAKAIMPRPPMGVYSFMKRDSPVKSRPNIFFRPPPVLVSIFILGLIQLMAPLWVQRTCPASG